MTAGPLFADQLRAHAHLLDAQFADGRPFLLGDDFSLALGVAIALAPPLEIHGIAIRREAPEVGEVVVHFPRAGFRVRKL